MIVEKDCLEMMAGFPDGFFDLVFCSPPYEEARTYGIDFDLTGQAYVDWCVERFTECLRVSSGLVAWIVEGTGQQTVNWSATPALLMADLVRAGHPVWHPSIYARYSTPGKFKVLRNMFEFIVCSSDGRQLPWSDPTACGNAPKCKPGGRTRPRSQDGSRNLSKTDYKQPAKVNAGNIVWCGSVGGGNIGNKMAHENEAPFPEVVAEFFIKSFCRPGGKVFDPFCGSGTTLAMAIKNGREAFGCDIRRSQVELSQRRIKEVKP